MSYTRSVELRNLNQEALKEFSHKSFYLTQMIKVYYFVHSERLSEGTILVDVWGDQQGAVDRFCEAFLIPIAQNPLPTERFINSLYLRYSQEITAYFEAINKQKFEERVTNAVQRVQREIEGKNVDGFEVRHSGYGVYGPFDLESAVRFALGTHSGNGEIIVVRYRKGLFGRQISDELFRIRL